MCPLALSRNGHKTSGCRRRRLAVTFGKAVLRASLTEAPHTYAPLRGAVLDGRRAAEERTGNSAFAMCSVSMSSSS